MKRVIIESPYAGDIERNTEYARRCLKDSLDRGEVPLASHLLYPQVLDEDDPEQRKQGIQAGYAWMDRGIPMIFYTDYSFSKGMMIAWETAQLRGVTVDQRAIGKNPGEADD